MRPEMLKKLDELMQRVLAEPSTIPAEVSLSARRGAWQKLRAEIVAERCDACRWWCANPKSPLTTQKCEYLTTFMFPDSCCSHFEKKEPQT